MARPQTATVRTNSGSSSHAPASSLSSPPASEAQRSTTSGTTTSYFPWDGSAEFSQPWYWRFVLSWLGYHHVLMMFESICILLLALVVAACTTTGTMQNLHLASFAYRQKTLPEESGSLMMNNTLQRVIFNLTLSATNNPARVREVQVGYLSNCVKLDPGAWQCGIKAPNISSIEAFDPLRIVEIAHEFRTKTVSCGLIIFCLILALLSTILIHSTPKWWVIFEPDSALSLEKPFPGRAVATLTLVCTSCASLGLLIAITWQHVAVASSGVLIEALRYESIEVRTGSSAAVLGWLSVFLSALVAIGLGILVSVASTLLGALEA
ncbi:Ca2+ regulator and membrane fusion protein Fig1-domain-containing protein [Thelonectria olida]|uniref:Ca2+ regulator and membrane fusion protein Fig1-domain-containing protein n=1 Tax=Thelonectria olida TaxID=1576542 RepID=A0A9P9APR2_9HYPO|nr:Ca2+ regulator and membrane fusion protein Fig1-domain-containing protein [Thelonectria olida]